MAGNMENMDHPKHRKLKPDNLPECQNLLKLALMVED